LIKAIKRFSKYLVDELDLGPGYWNEKPMPFYRDLLTINPKLKKLYVNDKFDSMEFENLKDEAACLLKN
jgi:hypothetical protein